MLKIDIYKKFENFTLNAEFSSDQGIYALFGPSGNGKSLILNAIAGFMTPDRGTISFDNHIFYDSGSHINEKPEKRGVGYILQDPYLFPHLSVKTNLLYGRRKYCRYSLDEVVEILEIGDLLNRRPGKLSGGEKQRVSIGRALLSNPGLLLMDEPVSSLDEESCWKILKFIKNVHKCFNMPILFVSHSLQEVNYLADEIGIIKNGLIIDSGPKKKCLIT
ncbi:MAG: ATP-binding cassette domain-containing protein [Spirochaetaceae bacterium]|jgi:molybdate transport system ATP-binding protein|nr:ATP-binding cassette domain-containing protein [Spirochaetaceae bacterium]